MSNFKLETVKKKFINYRPLNLTEIQPVPVQSWCTAVTSKLGLLRAAVKSKHN